MDKTRGTLASLGIGRCTDALASVTAIDASPMGGVYCILPISAFCYTTLHELPSQQSIFIFNIAGLSNIIDYYL